MKVAILGGTGNVGSRLTKELLDRGHDVTAISRHAQPDKLRAGVKSVEADVQNEGALAEAVAGQDAVIHSVRFLGTDAHKVIRAMKKAGVSRLLVVGGASSLEIAPGIPLLETPDFPDAYKPEASAGFEFLKIIREEKELEWTYLSPSAIFVPGKRTGKFRVGKDQLLVAEDGKSHISMEDYAIAMVNKLEKPQHVRERFTVGY